jgi:hypothetical protein
VGHEAGDCKGQQRCPAGSCALALTSGEGSEQRRPPGHAVDGMQGVAPRIRGRVAGPDLPSKMHHVCGPDDQGSPARCATTEIDCAD